MRINAKSFCGPPARTLLTYFGQIYLNTKGSPYIYTWGRDIKIFKSILALLTEQTEDQKMNKIKELIDLYFATPSKIYSPVYFRSNLSELVQKAAKQKPPEWAPKREDWRFSE